MVVRRPHVARGGRSPSTTAPSTSVVMNTSQSLNQQCPNVSYYLLLGAPDTQVLKLVSIYFFFACGGSNDQKKWTANEDFERAGQPVGGYWYFLDNTRVCIQS